MSVLDRIKGLFGVSFGVPGASTYQSAQDWVLGLPVDTYGSLVEPYAQSAAIATAVSTIAADAAGVEWEFYSESDDETEIEDHPLEDFWYQPNPYMHGSQLWVGTYVSLKLWGEAFWYYPGLKIGASDGLRISRRSTGQLDLLDPRAVMLDFAKDGTPKWTVRVSGEDLPLDARFLTQFKRWNPYSPWRGLSELASILMDAEGDYAAAQWNKNYFSSQNGIPSGLLVPGQGTPMMTDTHRRDILRTWNQATSAIKRSVGILPAGWDWKDLGVSQREMDFKALREYSREQILGVFGVPPFLAGVLDKANYANAREQKEVYWQGTIKRFLTGVQWTINADFLPKVGVTGVEVYPDWESVNALTENLNEKADVAAKFLALGFTKRQINDRLQLGFDVDELEDADVGYINAGLMPVTFALEPPEPAPMPGQPPEEGEDEEQRGHRKQLLRGDPTLREAVRSLRWRQLQWKTRDLEMVFNRVTRSHFRSIEADVLDTLNGMKGWMLRNSVTKAEKYEVFDEDEAKRKYRKQTEPLYRQAISRGGESVMAEINATMSFDMLMPGVRARLGDLLVKNARITDTVADQLRASLGEGLGLGESPQELAARVRQVMGASMSRSMTIARTETGYAFTSGRFEGMKQAGVRRKEWLSAKDERVRDDHRALDGQVVDMDDKFRVDRADGTGVLDIAYPLDPTAPADEVINCRCVMIPVISDVEVDDE